jgi:hypothetical protein
MCRRRREDEDRERDERRRRDDEDRTRRDDGDRRRREDEDRRRREDEDRRDRRRREEGRADEDRRRKRQDDAAVEEERRELNKETRAHAMLWLDRAWHYVHFFRSWRTNAAVIVVARKGKGKQSAKGASAGQGEARLLVLPVRAQLEEQLGVFAKSGQKRYANVTAQLDKAIKQLDAASELCDKLSKMATAACDSEAGKKAAAAMELQDQKVVGAWKVTQEAAAAAGIQLDESTTKALQERFTKCGADITVQSIRRQCVALGEQRALAAKNHGRKLARRARDKGDKDQRQAEIDQRDAELLVRQKGRQEQEQRKREEELAQQQKRKLTKKEMIAKRLQKEAARAEEERAAADLASPEPAPEPEPEGDGREWSEAVSPAPATAPANEGCTLHVRGVGGSWEDEEVLAAQFGRCGTVLQATVRHRIDRTSGLNTSWAQVSMMSSEEAQRVMQETFVSPEGQTLQITAFSQQQADQSTGAMRSISVEHRRQTDAEREAHKRRKAERAAKSEKKADRKLGKLQRQRQQAADRAAEGLEMHEQAMAELSQLDENIRSFSYTPRHQRRGAAGADDPDQEVYHPPLEEAVLLKIRVVQVRGIQQGPCYAEVKVLGKSIAGETMSDALRLVDVQCTPTTIQGQPDADATTWDHELCFPLSRASLAHSLQLQMLSPDRDQLGAGLVEVPPQMFIGDNPPAAWEALYESIAPEGRPSTPLSPSDGGTPLRTLSRELGAVLLEMRIEVQLPPVVPFGESLGEHVDTQHPVERILEEEKEEIEDIEYGRRGYDWAIVVPVVQQVYAAEKHGCCSCWPGCCSVHAAHAWLPFDALLPLSDERLKEGVTAQVQPLAHMNDAFDRYNQQSSAAVSEDDDAEQEGLLKKKLQRDVGWASAIGTIVAIDRGIAKLRLAGCATVEDDGGRGADTLKFPRLEEQYKQFCGRIHGAEVDISDNIITLRRQLAPTTPDAMAEKLQEAGLVVDILDRDVFVDGKRYTAKCLCIGASAERCLEEADRIAFPMYINDSRWEETRQVDHGEDANAVSPLRVGISESVSSGHDMEAGADTYSYRESTDQLERVAEVTEDMTKRFKGKLIAPFDLSNAASFRQHYSGIESNLPDRESGEAMPPSDWKRMDGAAPNDLNNQKPLFASGERQRLVRSIMKHAGVDPELIMQGVVQLPVPLGLAKSRTENLYLHASQLKRGEVEAKVDAFLKARETSVYLPPGWAGRDRFRTALLEELVWASKMRLHQTMAMRVIPLHSESDLRVLRDSWASWRHPSDWFSTKPLEQVKQYFGERIGLYFAFHSTYTRMLAFPAVIGVVCYVADWIDPESGEWFLAFYSMFIAIWSIAVLEVWARRERELKFEWAMEQQPLRGEVTPLFLCSEQCVATINEHFKREYVHKSSSERALQLAKSALIVLLYMAAVVICCTVCMWLRLSGGWWIIGSSAIILAQVLLFEFMFESWIESLATVASHRTQQEFESALAVKNWAFQFTNNFYVLFYVAFAKNGSVFGTDSFCQSASGNPTGDCLTEVQLQLAFLFCSKIVCSQIARVLIPFLKTKIARVQLETHRNFRRHKRDIIRTQGHGWIITSALCRTLRDLLCCRRSADSTKETEYAALPDSDHPTSDYRPRHVDVELSIMEQVRRASFNRGTIPGTFGAFNTMAVQFGFVVLFAPAFPLASLMALLNNITEMRTRPYQLCNALQRSPAELCDSIGTWFTVFKFLSVVAVATNALLVVFVSPKIAHAMDPADVATNDEYTRFSIGMLWALAVGVVCALLVLREVLHALIPLEPGSLMRARAALDALKQQMAAHAKQAALDREQQNVEQRISKTLEIQFEENIRKLQDSMEATLQRHEGSDPDNVGPGDSEDSDIDEDQDDHDGDGEANEEEEEPAPSAASADDAAPAELSIDTTGQLPMVSSAAFSNGVDGLYLEVKSDAGSSVLESADEVFRDPPGEIFSADVSPVHGDRIVESSDIERQFSRADVAATGLRALPPSSSDSQSPGMLYVDASSGPRSPSMIYVDSPSQPDPALLLEFMKRSGLEGWYAYIERFTTIRTEAQLRAMTFADLMKMAKAANMRVDRPTAESVLKAIASQPAAYATRNPEPEAQVASELSPVELSLQIKEQLRAKNAEEESLKLSAQQAAAQLAEAEQLAAAQRKEEEKTQALMLQQYVLLKPAPLSGCLSRCSMLTCQVSLLQGQSSRRRTAAGRKTKSRPSPPRSDGESHALDRSCTVHFASNL